MPPNDGTSQIMRDDHDGSVLVYPGVASYPYPDPWYWGPPIFIGLGASFVFVDRFHHFHHFHHMDTTTSARRGFMAALTADRFPRAVAACTASTACTDSAAGCMASAAACGDTDVARAARQGVTTNGTCMPIA